MHVHEAAYIRPIAELGETHEVVAIEDIRSRTGVKPLARGARIRRAVLERLLQHKLLKPIDLSAEIRDSVDTLDLIAEAEELMGRATEMAAVLRHLRRTWFIERLLRRVKLVPTTRNKLTVKGRILAFAAFAVGAASRCGLRHVNTIIKTSPEAFDRQVVGVFVRVAHSSGAALAPARTRLSGDDIKALLGIVTRLIGDVQGRMTEVSGTPTTGRLLEFVARGVRQLQQAMYRAGFDAQDWESGVRRMDGDPEAQAELESLLLEGVFQLRVVALELRRRLDAEPKAAQTLAPLREWLDLACEDVARARQWWPATAKSPTPGNQHLRK